MPFQDILAYVRTDVGPKSDLQNTSFPRRAHGWNAMPGFGEPGALRDPFGWIGAPEKGALPRIGRGIYPKGRYKKVEFMKTIFVKPQSVVKKWYLIDAEGKTLGRVAAEAAKILRGKNKAEYVPHQDLGDYVIIINAAKASVTGNKMEDKIYYRHSMYPGGLKAESLKKMLDRKPTYPMEHAIKGMLPHGKLGRRLFTNVKIYAGPEHPHQAQQPIAVEI